MKVIYYSQGSVVHGNHALEVQTVCAVCVQSMYWGTLTIDVPLFKKLQNIIFFWWENHFMSHFEGHFEGAKTFLTP